MRRMTLALALLTLLGTLTTFVLGRAEKAADKAPVEKLNKKIDSFTLADAGGKAWSLDSLKDKKAVVVVFLSFECPVSNSYAPTLAAMRGTRSSSFGPICPAMFTFSVFGSRRSGWPFRLIRSPSFARSAA